MWGNGFLPLNSILNTLSMSAGDLRTLLRLLDTSNRFSYDLKTSLVTTPQ